MGPDSMRWSYSILASSQVAETGRHVEAGDLKGTP